MLSPLTAWRRFLLGGTLCLLPWLAQSQTLTPAGLEFPVSGGLPGDQVHPAVSLGVNGGIVVWEDNAIDGKGSGIGARWLDAQLAPVGTAFRVNQVVLGDQSRPQVALLPNGSALVVWQAGKPATPEIFGRVLAPGGTFASKDFLVSTRTTNGSRVIATNWLAYRHNRQLDTRFRWRETFRLTRSRSRQPALAALADGSVAVTYSGHRRLQTNTQQLVQIVTHSGGRDYLNDVLRPLRHFVDWGEDILVQRLSAGGAKLGAEIVVNEFCANEQRHPSVAALAGGGFVVVWMSETHIPNVLLRTAPRIDIMGRVFDASGQPQGGDLLLNSGTNLCALPRVASRGSGFVATWMQRADAREDGWDVYAREFSSSGEPSGEAIRANEHTVRDQYAPQIAETGSGPLIVWNSLGVDDSEEGVAGRLNSGNAAEFRVNTTTLGKQLFPVVAADQDRALVVWSGYSYGASGGFELFAQKYIAADAGSIPPGPPPLAGDARDESLTAPLILAVGGAIEPPLTIRSGGSAVPGGQAVRLSLGSAPGVLELQWDTLPGRYYEVQYSENLRVWHTLGSVKLASGTRDRVSVDGGEEYVFFRVMRLR